MLQSALVHPDLSSLLCRVRHTNRLVIADVAFPFWPEIETVDLALTRGVPTVIQVLDVILPHFKAGHAWMAEEFPAHNHSDTILRFDEAFRGVPVTREPHLDFKKRVPGAIGLVRTGDPTLYGNVILESA